MRNKVGGRAWFATIFFGLVGQIAWIVENMYFSTLAQDIFANSHRADMAYLVTTLMVILSAITATLTTVIAGNASDRAGKRKPFIAWGYIIWGFTIMLFALLPMRVEEGGVAITAVLLIVFDCIMTVAGSTSNDAAFNAWVADNTDPLNRGRVNSVLSVLSVVAVVIVFIGLGGMYDAEAENNAAFFTVLGIIPIIAGIIALFTLTDKEDICPAISGVDFFYGFKPSTVRENPLLYVSLAAACIIGIAQQTFFSYLINFLVITLDLGDGFVVPMAVIIVLAAAFTGIFGMFGDKFGRARFRMPLLIMTVAGTASFFLLQYMQGRLRTAVIYIGGTLMMGGILSLTASFTSTFQNHIPKGCEGRYQGVRMCFTVLIPMMIGPVISLLIGLDAMGMNGESFVPPYTVFLASAIVAILAAIPIIAMRRLSDKEEHANGHTI